MWAHQHTLRIGGLIALGVDSSERFLLAVSHSGRGLFDLETGSVVARDEEDWAGTGWYSHTASTCLGIGPIEDEMISVSGIHCEDRCSSCSDGSLSCGAEKDDYSWKIFVSADGLEEELAKDEEELKAYGFSSSGAYFFIGISFEINVYKNTKLGEQVAEFNYKSAEV